MTSRVKVKPIIITIQRTGKRQSLTQQTQKDQELTIQRLKKNDSFLPTVNHFLESVLGKSPQKKALLNFANHLSAITHIQLDRLAKRSRDCLLCWYCENWELLLPHIQSILGISSSPSSSNCSESKDSSSISSEGSIKTDVPKIVDLSHNRSLPGSFSQSAPPFSHENSVSFPSNAFDSKSESIDSDFFSNELFFWADNSVLSDDVFCPLWN